jgi:N-acetylneuraminic acid mutarotase
VVAAGEKIFVLGDNTNQVDVFDPVTKTWKNGPDLPGGFGDCYGFGGGAIGAIIYIAGGWNCDGSYALNTHTGKWASFTNPEAHSYLMAFPMAGLNGKLYATGGYEDCWQPVQPDAEVFDPATAKWSTIAPMTQARAMHSLVAFGSKLIAAGGNSAPYGPGDTPILSTVESYDPATNKWTLLAPMKTARHNFALIAISAQLFAIGGQPDNHSVCSGEVFGPPPPTPPPHPKPTPKPTPPPTPVCNVPLNCGLHNNTAVCGHKFTTCDVCDTW